MYTPLSNEATLILGNLGNLKVWRGMLGGHIWQYVFPNNFGISIIKHGCSYGHERDLFEIAVIDHDGNLIYTTPITDDVIGYLTEAEVLNYARKIAALEDEEEEDPYYNWDYDLDGPDPSGYTPFAKDRNDDGDDQDDDTEENPEEFAGVSPYDKYR